MNRKRTSDDIVLKTTLLPLTIITATLYICTTAPPAMAQNNISITNAGYVPSVLFIARGSTVTWTNTDMTDHTVTSPQFDTHLGHGQSFSFQFNTPGIYNYFDRIRGFSGQISVT
jgi:plastocyanin